jgi:transcriptional regulator with XRE-family HTH domain
MNTAVQDRPISVTTRPRRRSSVTVAEYLTEQIRLSGKTQHEIANEAGFNKPNIISMFKKGETKLPLSKVGLMAKALGVDPVVLFRMVMNEYEPQTWQAIEETVLHQPVLTANEIEIIELLRTGKVTDPKIVTREDEIRLLDAVAPLGN